ncbi:O-antigen polymerase [Caldicellulosiruptor saccharolyticus DSM 8903]|uniref:O-antigen polymerase n=1 Tax=Caldicellulosiruptor saccharolyticus (strain ATCC 43494 / DSM 8903 / Tp8T 6331) TaxID=351627 RepID=A4XM07_CALS8|nr:O-antigen ligase family protein [Caldicellulosiruptor saccharolyticus]ABP67942.1 O-antigen polymerase [Caldicellulosiruptor saccharolyticus DSM 8903]
MVERKSLYITTFLIFLLGFIGSLVSSKIALFALALFLLVLVIFEDPSKLLYGVVFYAFVDFIFRKVGVLGSFASIWDEMLFILIVFAFILKSILNNNPKLRVSPLDIYIIVFLLICIFLLLKNSPNMRIAIEGFRVYAEYALWFFVGLNLLKNICQFKRFISVYIFMMFLISLYGIYQYIIGVEIPSSWIDSSFETYIRTRVYSIIGSPNVLGSLLAMSIPFVIPFVLYEKSISRRIYYFVVLISMIVCLGFTFSRGAWLAFLVSMILYGFFIDKRVLALLFSIIVLVPIFAPSILMRILYMLSSQYAKSSARAGRIARWTKAFEILKENLLFGVGFGRFGGAVAKRNIADAFYVDNFYLKSAVEMGIIGVIIMILTFVMGLLLAARVIKHLKSKELKKIGSGILIGLATVLIHNVVENIFEVPMMTTYFWLFLGFLFALKYIDSENITHSKEDYLLEDGGS